MSQLAGLVGELFKALGANERVFSLLDAVPGIDSFSGDACPNPLKEISIDSVSFKYPTRPDAEVLNSVTLRIAEGKTTALVGPSGSGKSTIVSLIQRMCAFASRDIEQLLQYFLRGVNNHNTLHPPQNL